MSVKPCLGLVNKAPFTQLGQRASKLGAGTEVHCFPPQRQSCVPGKAVKSFRQDSPEIQPRDGVNLDVWGHRFANPLTSGGVTYFNTQNKATT